MVNETKRIFVNDKEYFTQKNTVMEALDEIGIHVPRLCKHEDLMPLATCRLCVVKVNGRITTSCNATVQNDMKVEIDEEVTRARVVNLKLILSNHPLDCLDCFRDGSCELQSLAKSFDLPKLFDGEKRNVSIDNSSPSIFRDLNKCVLCGRCVEVCKEQGINAIDYVNRGFNTLVTTPYDLKISETSCISCGQCVLHCPTAALQEKDDRIPVIKELKGKRYVVAQIAPSVRVTIGEEFGLEPGNIDKKLVTALRMIGFDAVIDTSFGADATIMEEANEFVQRFKEKKLPMFTSCCSAWVNYVEIHSPDLISNLSTCKSPQAMIGALIKSYYAQKKNLDPKDIVVVSVMPCTAKKEEIKKSFLKNDGEMNVDYSLTTRELAKIFKEYGIDLPNVAESDFDLLDDGATSSGKIFGRSGGVMEAALRTASWYLGEKTPRIEFEETRGMKGLKTAQIVLAGQKVRIAVVNGMKHFIDNRESIMKNYDFIEVMACPGGCIAGGGQPQPHSKAKVKKRIDALNNIDENAPVRESHNNLVLKKIYDEFLIKPGSEVAEKYLHTRFIAKNKLIKY